MIIPMLCVTIFVILVVWFLLPRVARLMIHTPTAISIFVCLSMVQLMAVFISMRCTLCGHFLQVALTLILVVGYAIAASYIACKIRGLMVTVCPSQFATRRTLFHVLVGCGLLMLKVSRLKLPVIWLLVSMFLQTPKATSSTLYFDSLTVNAGNGGFLHCIQMDTSVNAANQVVSVGADIAFDADPKFFACLVRFESSSVPTTLPTAYDVYPLDG